MPLRAKYDALGVGPSASAEEIRRAYRRLALEHHPDKGGDPERMIAIQQAYETLSNPQRRARYDAGIDDDNRPHPTMSSMEELLRAMAGAGAAGANGFTYIFVNGAGGAAGNNVRRQASAAEAHVYVTLEQIYHATPVHADVDVRVRNVAESSTAQPAFRTERRRCSLKFRSVAETRRPVVVRQQGHQNDDPHLPDGDIIVRPVLMRHALYEPVANGNDLLYRHTVTLGDVLHGCEFTLQPLDHAAPEQLSLRVPPDQLRIEPGVVIQCDQEGMPVGDGRRGRLYILFDVDFSTSEQTKRAPLTKTPSTYTTWQRAPASVECAFAQSLFSMKAQHMLQRRQRS